MDEQASPGTASSDSTASEDTHAAGSAEAARSQEAQREIPDSIARSPGLNPPWPSFGAQASDTGLNDPDSAGAQVHPLPSELASERDPLAEPVGDPRGEPGSAPFGEPPGELGNGPFSADADRPHEFGPDDVVIVKASSVTEERSEAGQPAEPLAGAAGAAVPGQAGAAGHADDRQERWRSIQASFVDDPRLAVSQAADLVGQVIADLADRERALRAEWGADSADTEALRMALRRYRDLLERLPSL